MSEEWTIEEYRHYIATGELPGRGDRPRANAQLEQDTSAPPAREAEAQEDRSCYHVTVYSYRYRLLDPDNICSKWFIDGLVADGLLPDDSPENVEITHRQVKIGKENAEQTRFLIEKIA